MISVALFFLSAVSLTCLAFTSGWVGFVLAVLGFAPLIALIILHREPRPKRPVSPYLGRESQKWDEPNPTAHLDTTSSISKEPSS